MSSAIIVGQMLDGKYNIEHQLGVGGMGSVYLAIHIGTGRPVALKIIAPEYMRRAEFIERFRREARAAGKLRHPNVVDVTDFGFAMLENRTEVAYLVMELLDGCTLGDVLKEEKRVPLDFALDVMDQVCSAVTEAHRHGIIHRDLKPDNIWLEPNLRGGYTAKVLDFGIAKLEEFSDREDFVASQSDDEAAETAANTIIQDSTNSTKIYERAKTNFIESATVANADESQTLIAKDDEGATAILDSEGGTAIMEAYDEAETPSYPVPISLAEKSSEKRNDGFETSKLDSPISTELTRFGAVLGTPLYMSPEQCRGEKLTQKSDVYSLGVIAYQMISGKTPFQGDYKDVMYGHEHLPPPEIDAPKIPKKCRSIIMQALSKSTEDRPRSANAFAIELRAGSEGVSKLLRHAFAIYSERAPLFLFPAFIVFLPALFLTCFSSLVTVLIGFDVINLGGYAKSFNALLSLLVVVTQMVSVAIITSVTIWFVAQSLAFPLRPVSIWSGFAEVRKRWKTLFGTSVFTSVFIVIGLALCFVPGLILSVRWFFAYSAITLEGLNFRDALKRSNQLSKRIRLTVFAIVILMYLLPGVLAGLVGLAIGSTIKTFELTSEINEMKRNGVQPQTSEQIDESKTSDVNITINQNQISVANGGTDENQKQKKNARKILSESLQEGIYGLIWAPLSLVISSFLAVLSSLAYFRSLRAGGESMDGIIEKLNNADLPESEWQKKARESVSKNNRSTSFGITT